jgi:hypothetical protein
MTLPEVFRINPPIESPWLALACTHQSSGCRHPFRRFHVDQRRLRRVLDLLDVRHDRAECGNARWHRFGGQHCPQPVVFGLPRRRISAQTLTCITLRGAAPRRCGARQRRIDCPATAGVAPVGAAGPAAESDVADETLPMRLCL